MDFYIQKITKKFISGQITEKEMEKELIELIKKVIIPDAIWDKEKLEKV